MDVVFSFEMLPALLSLSFMEILLGIDNVIFIIILTNRLPKKKRPLALRLGLATALLSRLLLLSCLSLLMGLNSPLFTVLDHGYSLRDLIVISGGLFLIAKATFEIHQKVESSYLKASQKNQYSQVQGFTGLILQIILIDIIFSLDSVITAIGMVEQISIMVVSMILAVIVMMASVNFISGFIEKHPSLKILALAFLLLIGFVLVIEGLGVEMGKGSIYFAMFFSFTVELINIRYRTKKKAV